MFAVLKFHADQGKGAPSARANVGARSPIGLTWESGKCETAAKLGDGDVIPGEYLENGASQRHGANSVGWRRDGPGEWCAVHGAARATCKVGSSNCEETAVFGLNFQDRF